METQKVVRKWNEEQSKGDRAESLLDIGRDQKRLRDDLLSADRDGVTCTIKSTLGYLTIMAATAEQYL